MKSVVLGLLAFIVLQFFVAATATALGAEEAPGGRAEQQLRAYIGAFNSGKKESIQQYLDRNYAAPEPEIEQMMRRYQMTGGYVLRALEVATPGAATALLQEKETDQAIRAQIEVEANTPYQIRSLAFSEIPSPPDLLPKRLTQSHLVAAVRTRLAELAAADRFSGAVLIARNNKVVFSDAYGLANREAKRRNTVDTRFDIASITKMFTAIAVMQLVQAGKVDLDAPLLNYLPDYPNRDLAAKVTIHQLLTHTAGTGDLSRHFEEQHRAELRTIADYIALYGSQGPEFEPGTRFRYSNYGFVLLGAIIEKVTGTRYATYVHDHIFVPAKMRHTDFAKDYDWVPGRAIGYRGIGDARQPNADMIPVAGTPADGFYSTVGDLVAFGEALMENRLLSRAFTKLTVAGKLNIPIYGSYGYGFIDSSDYGVRSIGHGGGGPGANGELDIYPDTGYVVAVLSNEDPPARVGKFIGLRLPLGTE